MQAIFEGGQEDAAPLIAGHARLLDDGDGREQCLDGVAVIPWGSGAGGQEQESTPGCGSGAGNHPGMREVPALAPDTALEMALLEMARLRFMISSNSPSLTAGIDGPNSRLPAQRERGVSGILPEHAAPIPTRLTCCGCREPWPCRRYPEGVPGRRWVAGRRRD